MPQPVTPPNAPPRRTGRPPKINDPALRTRILDALRVGATYVHACAYGGIAYNTFNEWMKRGEAARSGAFRDFYEDVKKAEGDAVAKWLGVIDKAALDGQWQAAAWKLRRNVLSSAKLKRSAPVGQTRAHVPQAVHSSEASRWTKGKPFSPWETALTPAPSPRGRGGGIMR